LLDVSSHIDRYFKVDLGEVAEGRVLVFHSLRHSTATMLSVAGASPREQMEVMRHQDHKLTVHYTDFEQQRLRELGEKAFSAVLA